jgi:2-oxoglutarate ferredoxin oxidoreductase subunit alpha
MAIAGEGHHINVDSLTHDERGYPSTRHDVSERMLEHITGKIRNNLNTIVQVEHYLTDDAKIIVIAYGSTSRSALHAVKQARRVGKKVGLLRLITPWPFPAHEVEQLGSKVKAVVVPEINYGQMEHPVRENVDCQVIGIHHAAGSLVPPEKIYAALEKL